MLIVHGRSLDVSAQLKVERGQIDLSGQVADQLRFAVDPAARRAVFDCSLYGKHGLGFLKLSRVSYEFGNYIVWFFRVIYDSMISNELIYGRTW